MKEFRPLLTDPAKGIFHILNDQRQLRFRSQPIVDGNEYILILTARFRQPARNALAMPHNERPAMNPDNNRPLLSGSSVDVGFDGHVAGLFVGVGHFLVLGIGGVDQHEERQHEERDSGVGHGSSPKIQGIWRDFEHTIGICRTPRPFCQSQ